MLTITARHRIFQLVNKAHLSARIHVQILPFGLNQTEGVKFAEENLMVRHVLQTVDKELKKIKEELEQNLDEELPNIVEMKSVCDRFTRCKDCLVSYKVNKEIAHKC